MYVSTTIRSHLIQPCYVDVGGFESRIALPSSRQTSIGWMGVPGGRKNRCRATLAPAQRYTSFGPVCRLGHLSTREAFERHGDRLNTTDWTYLNGSPTCRHGVCLLQQHAYRSWTRLLCTSFATRDDGDSSTHIAQSPSGQPFEITCEPATLGWLVERKRSVRAELICASNITEDNNPIVLSGPHNSNGQARVPAHGWPWTVALSLESSGKMRRSRRKRRRSTAIQRPRTKLLDDLIPARYGPRRTAARSYGCREGQNH